MRRKAPQGIERVLELVRRELGTTGVCLASPWESVPEEPDVVSVALPLGWRFWVRLSPSGPSPNRARAMLVVILESFEDRLERWIRSMSPAPRALRTELQTCLRELVESALAYDAVVIDTKSPVIWGSASRVRWMLATRPNLVVVSDTSPLPVGGPRRPRGQQHRLTREAIAEVRRLPEIADLVRGGHVRHAANAGELGYFVRSFASIYLLILVYRGQFDELRAERAMARFLPMVERLVLARPPEGGPGSAAGARRR